MMASVSFFFLIQILLKYYSSKNGGESIDPLPRSGAALDFLRCSQERFVVHVPFSRIDILSAGSERDTEWGAFG